MATKTEYYVNTSGGMIYDGKRKILPNQYVEVGDEPSQVFAQAWRAGGLEKVQQKPEGKTQTLTKEEREADKSLLPNKRTATKTK